MRLISVTMGEETADKRSADTLAMLDYGFNMYSIDTIVSKDNLLGNIKVNLGEEENVSIKISNDINILNNNQAGKRNITYEVNTYNVNAPVKVGDTIGKILVYEDGKYLFSENITVVNDIDKANIFKIFIRNLRDIFTLSI